MHQFETTDISEIWRIYIWWGLILILKTMALVWYTGQYRVHYKVIHSQEDKMWFDDVSNLTLKPAGNGHPQVDKIRSAHLNAVEFIAFYTFIVPLWILTTPENLTVNIVLRLLSLSRILYTISCMGIFKILENFKSLFLAINYVASIYIIFSNIMYYFAV